MRSVSGLLQGDLGFWGLKFDDITLTAGQSYLLQVGYEESADENWFFDFDPVVFGDTPVDIGAITLIDGTRIMSLQKCGTYPKMEFSMSPLKSTVISPVQTNNPC